MNCLVIGYGSIGSRHAFILKDLDFYVKIVSKREIHSFERYESIEAALNDSQFDYIIIANDTCAHYDSFIELQSLGFSGKILIEKPIFGWSYKLPKGEFKNVYVGYNLRFDPILQKLYQLISGKKLYSVQVYCGRYLPTWRSNTNYERCYSAFKARGGGVLRDLSHELDYVNWLTGGWKRVASIGGKFSDLRINSDDVYLLLLEMKNCPVAGVQINYLDQKPRREIVVNMKDFSIRADLINRSLEVNDDVTTFDSDSNLSYKLEHKAIMAGDDETVCTYREGIEILELIQSVESAANRTVWISKRKGVVGF